jgi:hypothetical protein
MGADGIDAPPLSADSPLPGSDKSPGGPDASPHRDEGTPATDLDLRPIHDIEPVHHAPTGEAPGDANPVATTNVDVPLADSPLSRTGTSLGGPDTGPHRDERTPATDDAADSPAKTKGPDAPASALPGDEGHELTNRTDPRADGSRSLRDKFMHGIAIAGAAWSMGADVVPPAATVSGTVVSAAEAVGTVSDAIEQTEKLGTDFSAVVHGELNPPGTGGAEHLATEPSPEGPVDKAPDPAGPGVPDSPVSDDVQELLHEEGERDKAKAEAEKAALESRLPDRFPRTQNSPKISDQVRDRRPTPTGRGQSRGRPK